MSLSLILALPEPTAQFSTKELSSPRLLVLSLEKKYQLVSTQPLDRLSQGHMYSPHPVSYSLGGTGHMNR